MLVGQDTQQRAKLMRRGQYGASLAAALVSDDIVRDGSIMVPFMPRCVHVVVDANQDGPSGPCL